MNNNVIPDFAFPSPCTSDGHGANVDPGMTLRDYFAAKAPITFADAVFAADLNFSAPDRETAVIRTPNNDVTRQRAMKMLAEMRFEYADAMLAEREKQA